MAVPICALAPEELAAPENPPELMAGRGAGGATVREDAEGVETVRGALGAPLARVLADEALLEVPAEARSTTLGVALPVPAADVLAIFEFVGALLFTKRRSLES